MNAATRWLMKADARAVMLGLIAALCLTGAWFTWEEFSPPDSSLPSLRKPKKGSRVEVVDLGLLAAVESRRSYARMQIPGNPFMSSDKAWTWSPSRASRPKGPPPPPAKLLENIMSAARNPPTRKPNPPPPRRAPPARAPAAVPVPAADPKVVEVLPGPAEDPAPGVVGVPRRPREVVRLTYRGSFRRSDGRVLALIHDSKSDRAVFYAVGADVLGVTVLDINNAETAVLQANGEAAALIRGEESPFEEGNHAD